MSDELMSIRRASFDVRCIFWNQMRSRHQRATVRPELANNNNNRWQMNYKTDDRWQMNWSIATNDRCISWRQRIWVPNTWNSAEASWQRRLKHAVQAHWLWQQEHVSTAPTATASIRSFCLQLPALPTFVRVSSYPAHLFSNMLCHIFAHCVVSISVPSVRCQLASRQGGDKLSNHCHNSETSQNTCFEQATGQWYR